MRCDDATNMHGREYMQCWQKISKRKALFGIYLLRQKNTNTIYGRKVELSMWIGLIWIRMFFSDGI
jgi:hypothetical protein